MCRSSMKPQRRDERRSALSSVSMRAQKWNSLYESNGKRYGEFPSTCCGLAVRHIRPFSSLIQLGCGYGRDVLHIARNVRGVEVQGVDSSERAISILAEDSSSDWNVSCVVCDIFAIEECTTEKFDTVYAHFLFHLFLRDERAKLLNVTKTLLEPGGMMIASFPSVGDPKRGRGGQVENETYRCYADRLWHHMHFYTEREVRDSLVSSGYSLVQLLPYVEVEHILRRSESTQSWFAIGRNQEGQEVSI